MKPLLKSLLKHKILKNIALLTTGTAIAQTIGVAISPILSRLYSPESFGVLGAVMAIGGPITVIASLKYEQAIVLEEDDKKADNLKRLSFLLTISFSLLTLLGIFVYLYLSRRLGFSHENQELFPWSVLFVFFGSTSFILIQSLNRKSLYKIIATSKVFGQISSNSTMIFLGFCLGGSTIFLIAGKAIGLLVPIIYILFKDKPSWLFNKESLSPVVKKHYRFPLYSAPQNLLNSISQNLPIYMLGSFFGLKIVGLYWFAMRILQLPIGLIAQSVRQVFYKEASEMKNDPIRLRRFFLKMTGGLFLIILLPVTVVFIWGPDLFGFVFGKEWIVAGEYSRWMFLWVGMLFVNPPAISLFNVLNLQKYALLFDGILLIMRAVSLIIGGMYLSSLHTIIFYSFVGLFFNIVVITFIFLKTSRWRAN